MSKYLDRIAKIEQDAEQSKALHSSGSQVVVAGPGSGKTYLLTSKIAKTLLEGRVRFPQKVACVTFSRRLAADLSDELQALGVYDPARLYVGTIHGFCIAEILMPIAHLLPPGTLPTPLRIASDAEAYTAIDYALGKQGIRPLPLATKGPDWKRLGIKNNLDNYRKHYFVPSTGEFASEAFAACNFRNDYLSTVNWSLFAKDYEASLMNSPAPSVDFVQIETLALSVILKYPTLMMTLAAAYPWLFVDEYQDLSPLFHQIVIRLLASDDVTVFAIGDPNQCIYEELQGSKPSYLTELAEEIKQRNGNGQITLQTNYRSAQNIIDLGDIVLENYTGYKASVPEPGSCHVILVNSVQYENVVKQILDKRLRQSEDTSAPSEMIALLAPTRRLLNGLWNTLEENGTWPIAIDQHPDFEQKTDLTNWVLDLACWCAGSKIYFHQLIPFWLRLHLSVFGAFDERQRTDLERSLFSVLHDLRIQNLAIGEWLTTLADALEFDTLLECYGRQRPGDVVEWRGFYDAINGSKQRNQSVQQFAQLDAKVFLTTLHSSKGLEFDTTILVGLDQIRQSDSIPDLGARLAYVAVTRAKTRLYMLLPDNQSRLVQRLREQPEHILKCWKYRNGELERLPSLQAQNP